MRHRARKICIEAEAQRKELVLAVRMAADRLPEEQRSLRDVAQACGTAFNVAQNTR